MTDPTLYLRLFLTSITTAHAGLQPDLTGKSAFAEANLPSRKIERSAVIKPTLSSSLRVFDPDRPTPPRHPSTPPPRPSTPQPRQGKPAVSSPAEAALVGLRAHASHHLASLPHPLSPRFTPEAASSSPSAGTPGSATPGTPSGAAYSPNSPVYSPDAPESPELPPDDEDDEMKE